MAEASEPTSIAMRYRSAYSKKMENASQPGPTLAILVVAAVIVAANWAPGYVVNPAGLDMPARQWAAVGLAVVAFCSFTTLNMAVYCLMVARNSKTSKEFLSAVMNRAAIGAVLGTLLGLKISPIMVAGVPGKPTPTFFPGFQSDLSNVITLVTLALVATAWPYCWGVAFKAIADWQDPVPLNNHAGKRRLPYPAFVLMYSHWVGIDIGYAFYLGILGSR